MRTTDWVTTIRIDLHTHTYRSGDSKTPLLEFAKAAADLDLVAVTDHHDIYAASLLNEQFGLPVIQGEEINTGQGEVIGLYLTEPIPRLLGLAETCRRIRSQGGLVYVPHPTDTARHAIGIERLASLCQRNLVDIVEVGNSKSALVDRQAEVIARSFELPVVAASDAHVAEAIGSSFTTIPRLPNDASELVALLMSSRYHHEAFDPVRDTTKTVILPGNQARY
jgi:predicted metal-dependent phosphoesterase TrpH